MASFEEHCDECSQKLGKPYEEVHKWLDAFFAKCGFSELHRDRRHHLKAIEEIRVKYGQGAYDAAVLHIERDFYGYLPKDEKDVQKWRMGVIHRPGLKEVGGILVPDGSVP